MPAVEELSSSVLGTKNYWDKIYENEVINYKESGFNDKGEIWFGEDSAEKMVDWVVETKEIPKDKRIIDLGCGNGHLIFALYELEYKNLLGVDYSPLSIELCETIQKQQGVPTDALNWMKIDILNHQEAARMGLFDVVLDKGTFDAISLASREEGQSPSPANRYVESVAEMLDSDGILLITSCNWTEDELISRFSNRFTLLDRVKYPSFKFGGVQGQKITTLAFQKNTSG